jgi:hypothetical protein
VISTYVKIRSCFFLFLFIHGSRILLFALIPFVYPHGLVSFSSD